MEEMMRKYSEYTDDILVTLTLAGNQCAYEELVIRHQKRVLAAAFAVTHNNYMAEDAAQDAFVTAWMKLDMLNDPTKFCPWVCKIARNLAKNMIVRFRNFIPFESLGDTLIRDIDPALESFEENEVLRGSVERLPEKIQRIIHLHYFEGLSISEIAAKLMIPVGTVKWQLSDGRQKLRKELCAMNEKDTDTLVEKVMKKVEEMKLWQVRHNKSGFEKVYEEVLADVEALPESKDKAHALADVLKSGWWWLPGEKNDELFARIKKAAMDGHNDEVMEFIVGTEDEKLNGDDLIEFVTGTQIPFLEKHDFPKSLGREWFWLGHEYFRKGDTEAGFAAYDKVLEILEPSDAYYANALSAIELEKLMLSKFKNKDNYHNNCTSEYLRFIDGEPRYWAEPGYHRSENGWKLECVHLAPLYYATRCDCRFFVKGAKVGDSFTSPEGVVLKFTANDVTVTTPCGVFDNCELWEIHDRGPSHTDATFYDFKTYYKDGVGIVKFEVSRSVGVSAIVLKDYTIVGGDGLFPLHKGNTWEYVGQDNDEYKRSYKKFSVVHADDKCVNISAYSTNERMGYSEDSWDDMVLQMAREYVREIDGNEKLSDVSHAMERAKILADTPYRKTYTELACDVMERIFTTDAEYNPARTHSGHWNFFDIDEIVCDGGRVFRENVGIVNHFEWKNAAYVWQNGGWPIMFNMIYDAIQCATDCLWNDEWLEVREYHLEKKMYGFPGTVDVAVTDGETVVTPAGDFTDCVKVTLDIKGFEKSGCPQFGGLKDYYFAPGIGIVRADNHYYNDDMVLVTGRYDLTYFVGTGDGYMPIQAGMKRYYDAVDLAGGFTAWARYAFEEGPGGGLICMENLCGIREIPKE